MNSNYSILLVEDTESHAVFVIKVLNHQGYEIHWESTGKAAIEYCKTQQPKLLLMDIALPDINGEEVAKKIRTLQTERIPIIAITAHSLNETKKHLLASGFDDYLSKPFGINDLIEIVKKYIPNK
jgi:DNA-binding response OmpR family regulator